MVVRNAGLSFAASAMVFPGGKLIAADEPAAMGAAIATGHALDAIDEAHAVAALREAYEEAGILMAHYTDGRSLSLQAVRALDVFRSRVDSGEANFGAVLREAGLVLILDNVVPFAHIIGPRQAPRRFDTRFFIAPAPEGQMHVVDDHEIIAAQWVTAFDAIAMGDADERLVMHPTRLVLGRLQHYATVAEALAEARRHPPKSILPEVQTRDGVAGLYTPGAPGINEQWEALNSGSAKRRGFG